ncbi:VOC family protein [Micromonospora sp. NPDC023956]|uniref:VOC family protein n=1 Tax=Micromonospora sp. NPDC023956 TaxID=3155722 RepID=UPI00340F2877
MAHTPPPAPVPRFHHVGVQTNDLDNTLSWYADFLGARPAWSLETFSALTRSRLPGITRLTEVAVGDVRLHLFERKGRPAPAPGESLTQFQHVCLAVDHPEELDTLRERWIGLFRSGRYTFALPEPPTDVVADDDGVRSLYVYDVNGLEWEFTHVPGEAR